jgi:hypothetical protein
MEIVPGTQFGPTLVGIIRRARDTDEGDVGFRVVIDCAAALPKSKCSPADEQYE